jgi:hypothetical protein
MPTNSRNTIVRLGVLVFVVALALTAAYYYGVARAQSVVALPTSISLTGPAATAQPAATTQPTATTLAAVTAQPATTRPSTTATTSHAPRPAPSASTPTTRHVVTPIRGWDHEPDHGSAPSGGSGTGTVDCE